MRLVRVRPPARSSGLITACSVGALLALAAPAHATPACPISYGATDDAKPNKLYLYFPTASDATYPEFSVNAVPTSPVQFNPALLTSYTGTAAQLRDATFDVVSDDYCEFNVQVRQTTTAPPATFARRNTVAIGTDTNVTAADGTTWGQAQAVDTGDASGVDFAREWAGSYQDHAGGIGGALNGANSTVARWANSVGGTAAHEAGHSYGVSHPDGLVVGTGEDALTRHIMARGVNYTDEQRAGYRRHFSDHEMSILAANVGLSIQTMHNWDMVNPNAAAARRLRITFLAPSATVTQSWSYSGDRSPWVNPTVSGSLGTQTFKGTSYHRHTITWSTGQAWSGGASGTVPGGAPFHVGATFSSIDFDQPDPIIITKTELLDSGGTPLALSPRLPGYDAGTLDASDGTLDMQFTNLAGGQLDIADVLVREFPRPLSIDALLPGAKLFDVFGEPTLPWPESSHLLLGKRPVALKRGAARSLTLAKLGQGRHILERVDRDCARGGGGDAESEPDVRSCRPGFSVDLFPATTVVVKATAIARNVKHFSRRVKRYVRGDVRSTVYVQIAGRHPDLDHNRRDDAIDIATGKATDRNQDGVPDSAQRKTEPTTKPG
jgi:hypothetical protein